MGKSYFSFALSGTEVESGIDYIKLYRTTVQITSEVKVEENTP